MLYTIFCCDKFGSKSPNDETKQLFTLSTFDLISIYVFSSWGIISIISFTLISLLLIGEISSKENIGNYGTIKFFMQFIGSILLSFTPFIIDSIYPILLFAIIFGFITVAPPPFQLDVFKKSTPTQRLGSQMYPWLMLIMFYLNIKWNSPVFFILPLLIFAISDGFAYFVGTRKPWNAYKIGKSTKTMSGSLAFLISAFFISFLVLLGLFPQLSLSLVLMVSSVLAVSCTIVEAVTPKGWDNLTIFITSEVILYLTLMYIGI